MWFQHYRKENFHDESLPPGKWTKRESKQNWVGTFQISGEKTPLLTHDSVAQRTTYLNTIPNRSPPQSPRSGYLTPLRSGQQTPREIREEKWKQEADGVARPSKVEMREMYKELGGRKARGKGKLGGTSGMRDRGGWGEVGAEEF